MMLLDEDWTLEIVPVDHVANLVMAAGWQNGTEWITRNTNGTQRGPSNQVIIIHPHYFDLAE